MKAVKIVGISVFIIGVALTPILNDWFFVLAISGFLLYLYEEVFNE